MGVVSSSLDTNKTVLISQQTLELIVVAFIAASGVLTEQIWLLRHNYSQSAEFLFLEDYRFSIVTLLVWFVRLARLYASVCTPVTARNWVVTKLLPLFAINPWIKLTVLDALTRSTSRVYCIRLGRSLFESGFELRRFDQNE